MLHINAYRWNLEKMIQMNVFSNRNRDKDVENKSMDMKGRRGKRVGGTETLGLGGLLLGQVGNLRLEMGGWRRLGSNSDSWFLGLKTWASVSLFPKWM